MVSEKKADGSTLYTRMDTGVSDVTLNGVSIFTADVIEARVWADGWGYVCTLARVPDGVRKTQVDGHPRTYHAYGWVGVVPG
jgi:hypothetical protein